MEEKFCPCCNNRCPADALSCGRGRAYFGNGAEGGVRESRGGHGGHGFHESKDEVINLLLKIGHTLHHSHGQEEMSIGGLDDKERAQLIALLKKCLAEIEK